jgi:hypothetical protein
MAVFGSRPPGGSRGFPGTTADPRVINCWLTVDYSSLRELQLTDWFGTENGPEVAETGFPAGSFDFHFHSS